MMMANLEIFLFLENIVFSYIYSQRFELFKRLQRNEWKLHSTIVQWFVTRISNKLHPSSWNKDFLLFYGTNSLNTFRSICLVDRDDALIRILLLHYAIVKSMKKGICFTMKTIFVLRSCYYKLLVSLLYNFKWDIFLTPLVCNLLWTNIVEMAAFTLSFNQVTFWERYPKFVKIRFQKKLNIM